MDDVGEIQRVEEFAIRAIAGGRHEIKFREAGFARHPVIRLGGKVMLQQGPRLRAAKLSPPDLAFE